MPDALKMLHVGVNSNAMSHEIMKSKWKEIEMHENAM
jgi:hypothetical protein